jgi:hypothetical protein
VLALPLKREALRRAAHLRHRRHLLDHCHHWDPHQRSPRAAHAHRCLSMGDPSGKAPIVDLSSSSDEKGLIPNTLRDVEFARKLFSDLNCNVLGTPGDDKFIVLSDSDEEEDVREEITTDADGAPSSAVGIPASTASTTDTEEALKGVQDDNIDD